MADINKDKIAITVKGVSKTFRLPHERQSTVKSTLVNLAKGKRSRYFDEQKALDDISFEVNKGEFFGIVGRNGSGKSTLLKLLAGIYQPSSGKVETKGKLVPFIELGVGFNPELTGRENVFLNGAMLGFSREEISKRYDKIVGFAELKDFMDQKLKNYSSGMQVRLAFSVAIQADAEILLIDEVLAVGDSSFQKKCYEYFHYLKRHNKTVVFVSHDMQAIREYCDRVLLIEDSEMKAIGSSRKVSQLYGKLFSDEPNIAENFNIKKGSKWGDGSAKFEFAKVNISQDRSEIVMECKIVAQEDVNNLVVGVAVKNNDGDAIAGYNFEDLNVNPLKMRKGEASIISWKMQNIFSQGQYSIDFAAHYSGGGERVAEWWNDASNLVISKKSQSSSYDFSPKTSVSVKKS